MTPLNTTTENEKLGLDERIYSREGFPTDESNNVLDFSLLLAQNKRAVARITLLCVILGTVGSLFLRNTYTAQSRILPPQQNQSSLSALFAQAGSLSNLLGKDLGAKNPSDVYVTMLQSRSVADALIKRFDLQAVYKAKELSDAREELKSATEVTSTKDGVITISVDDHDPSRAAALANGYVEELYKVNQRLVVTEAGQRRIFFERELQQAKENLADAEIALKKTQEQTGLIQIDAQAKSIIEGVARLRAQLSAKQVQLQSMRSFATEQNFSVQRLKNEISAMQAQLQLAEGEKEGGNGDIQIPTGTMPRAGLEYLRRFRDVKYNETLFEIMAKQFELAKIDEAKSAAMIQILDVGVPPDRKSKPHRLIIVLVSLFIGVFLSTIWVLARDTYQRMQENPATKAKLQRLRTYLPTKI